MVAWKSGWRHNRGRKEDSRAQGNWRGNDALVCFQFQLELINPVWIGSDDYSDDGDDLEVFLAEDDSDEDEAEDAVEEIPVGRKSKKPKKDSSAPLFANADEYEEMIEESFSKLNSAAAATTTEKTENTTIQKESSLSKKKSKKGKKNRKRS